MEVINACLKSIPPSHGSDQCMTGVPGENHRSAVSHWQTLSHNIVSSTPSY
jgi:hypothetical protein